MAGSSSTAQQNADGEPPFDPLTLRFNDPELESLLRRQKFLASSGLTSMTLLFFVAIHVGINQIVPSTIALSAFWVPLIVLLMVLRISLSFASDQLWAHQVFSYAWTTVLAVGNALSRLVIQFELLPPFEGQVFGLYMMTFVCTFFMMQLQYMDFRAVIVGWLSVAVCYFVVGAFGAKHFSVMEHPSEGLLAMAAASVGTFMGREVQKMLRGHFAVHVVLKRTQNQRANERDRERKELEMDLSDGRYLQLGLIGRGSAADVFLARRTSASVPHPRGASALCAIKRIKKSNSHKLEMRLLEEYNILQALSHPFLVELHHAFQSERCFYFVMTYAGGGDLTRWIGELEERIARVVIAEVLMALGYLHGEGILYRDVKPDNTLVCSNGHILLADFGVSKSAERVGGRNDPRSAELSRSNTQVGTVQYMSPEVMSGEAYSFEVDFWALGVMLHEIITGHTIGLPMEPEVRTGELAEPTASLTLALLNSSIDQRLGVGNDGLQQIQAHAYFDGIDWEALLLRPEPGPIRVDRLTLSHGSQTPLIDAESLGRKND